MSLAWALLGVPLSILAITYIEAMRKWQDRYIRDSPIPPAKVES